MKKIISITLAVIMVALACPLTIFAAASGTPAAGDKITTGVASIVYTDNGAEKTHGTYDTLDAAVEALADLYKPVLKANTVTDGDDADTNVSNELYAAAGSPVIKLNGNFDGAAVYPNWIVDGLKDGEETVYWYSPDKVITVVIDGAKSATENYVVSCGGITLFDALAFYNLTVKNTVITFSNSAGDNSIRWNGNIDTNKTEGARIPGESFTVFENCVMDQNYNGAPGTNEGGFFKLNGFKKAASNVDSVTTDKFNLTLKDCTINSASSVGLQVHWGADATVNLVNTTWTLDGVVGNGLNNDCILKAYESGKINFNVDGNSKLIAARAEGSKTVTLIRTNTSLGGDVTVTLGQGAELVMNNTATESLTGQVYYDVPTPVNHTATVTDNGAIFKANAASQKLGVTLPTFYDSAMLPHVWKIGTELVSNPYKNAAATADVTLVHAADNDPANNPNNVAYIEKSDGTKTYFTSIQYAVNALDALYSAVTTANLTDDALWKAAGSPVIVLYKDTTISSTVIPSWWQSKYNANRVRTVYIKGVKADGTNVKIESTAAGAAFQYMSYYNFTMENIDLNCTQGFALFWSGYHGAKNSAKSTTNMINCSIKATGTTGEGLVFKVTGNQNQSKTENYIINMVKTTVTATAGSSATSAAADSDGVNAVFLFHHGAAGTLNMDGESVIKHYNKRQTAGGDTVFMLGTNRYFDINVASGALIEGTVTRTSAGTYSIFRTEDSNDYSATGGKAKNTINIEKGATISVNANDAFTKPVAIIWQLTAVNKAPTVINIANGAILKVNAKAAELGFDVIKGANFNSDLTVFGWNVTDADNKTTLYGDDTFAAGVIEGDVSITPVCLPKTAITMVQNAGLKVDGNGSTGLAFRMNVSKELLDIIGEGEVTYGMLVAPQEWTVFGFDKAHLGKGQCIDLTADATALKGTDGDKTCTLGFSGYPIGDAVLLPVSARGYVTFKIGEQEVTIYSADSYTTSVYDIASALAKDGYADNATVQQILAVAEA